ncbi:hypothetical protein M0813_19722 [Anaeramoeba flamelloides]|uniref:Uncharacterized protein n=1 Tax=Anaeramoeba flamelloides TaxID=1746091 RepID=A0ABQ8YMY3_9EUKA|nr:hypothetical protein M0813_19722 [Anaeramoeba flamelloides]
MYTRKLNSYSKEARRIEEDIIFSKKKLAKGNPKIQKYSCRTKTLNINEGEFNGDIEIFKEVDDNVDTNEFVEENFDKMI